ncbi:MAG: UDP-glucose 4-epimerase GalE [Cytophagales bacterium]
MKILVTGGCGFIGSHTVVALVEEGFEPILVDDFSNSERFILQRLEKITKRKLKLYEGDCCDIDFMEKIFSENRDMQGIIHFAAYKSVPESVANPLKYYVSNLTSLCNILKVSHQFSVTNLIFSSSCTVYGIPDQLPVTEETPTKPANSPYGNTKKICEDILKDFVAVNDLKTYILRYFNPIGAHPSGEIGELPIGVPGNLVPFITQTAIGKRDKLVIFGKDYATKDGTNIRDFIDVCDLALAHVKAVKHLISIQSPKHLDVFNIGTGNGCSVLEAVEAFEKANQLKLNYVFGERRAGDVEAIFANVEKAEKTLNWKSTTTLEKSMENAWRWEKHLKELELN